MTETISSRAASAREAAPAVRDQGDGGRLLPPAFGPVIATARLVLRPLRAGDVADIFSGIGDLSVSRNLARVPHPYTREQAGA